MSWRERHREKPDASLIHERIRDPQTEQAHTIDGRAREAAVVKDRNTESGCPIESGERRKSAATAVVPSDAPIPLPPQTLSIRADGLRHLYGDFEVG